jgi:transcriptional regulator with PAS, ATPase and Fis domain
MVVCDVRVSAVNQDLRELVAAGTFRADLFYRLNIIRIHCRPCASGARICRC